MSFGTPRLVLAALVLSGCVSAVPPDRPLGAGFRYSAYGPEFDPGPEYWSLVGFDMARRFDGAHPETIWIVGRLYGHGTLLNFSVKASDKLITGSATDENEATLDLFDRLGVKVWLQIEPGFASVDELIDLILERYRHHPSVIGFGLDVEWYNSTDPDEGQAVTDEEARRWLEAIRRHKPEYRLFLKHFAQHKMPPTAREGILFVDDSQIFPSFEAMVDEFESWGKKFAPAPVAFQYGYPSDRPWWSMLDDPPGDIGRAIVDRVPNTEGLYWVDFTVLELFPPLDEPSALKIEPTKFEGLALTPPMGWNSWNHFGCTVDETLIREVADAMVASGMKDAGYQYVNIDDCWHGERDELGFIQPDPKRFPSGMKALADYVHSKGLKLGIYSDAGWKDYLKYDWCNTEGLAAPGAYMTMSRALRAGPDRWNDPDMLEVGNGMTAGEDRAHFSMWSMLAAPLIAGNDVRTMSEETRAILTNRDVIAVNQDPLGVQGSRHRQLGVVDVWVKLLSGGALAVAMLNRSTEPQSVTLDWAAQKIGEGVYSLRDLWTKELRGDTSAPFTAEIPPHDVILLRLEEK